jgi:hypothetical protein
MYHVTDVRTGITHDVAAGTTNTTFTLLPFGEHAFMVTTEYADASVASTPSNSVWIPHEPHGNGRF